MIFSFCVVVDIVIQLVNGVSIQRLSVAMMRFISLLLPDNYHHDHSGESCRSRGVADIYR
jgi:hypothetical protein